MDNRRLACAVPHTPYLTLEDRTGRPFSVNSLGRLMDPPPFPRLNGTVPVIVMHFLVSFYLYWLLYLEFLDYKCVLTLLNLDR